ncbi:MAG: hypothetical protein WA966_07635 [Ornithinimicrobium sp.]
MSKLTMAAAAAVGYVLGARAGRERYDQLSEKAESLWNNPKVQQGKRRAQQKADEVTSDGTESSLSEVGDQRSDTSDEFHV